MPHFRIVCSGRSRHGTELTIAPETRGDVSHCRARVKSTSWGRAPIEESVSTDLTVALTPKTAAAGSRTSLCDPKVLLAMANALLDPRAHRHVLLA